MHRDYHAVFTTGLVLVLIISIAQSHPLRNRRQTMVNWIDTLVVVDDRMFSWFQQWLVGTGTSNVSSSAVTAKLIEYVSLVIHQANVRFSNMKDLSYVIGLRVVNISINQNVVGNLQTSSNSGKVDPDKALDTFRTWLFNRQLGRLYDHAIMLTGYALVGGSVGTETKGKSYVGRMCDVEGYSASVVQESGGFQSAHYVTHEVGHNLGSVHDGEGQSSSCSSTDRFIMAPTRDNTDSAGNKINPWYFSRCSTTEVNINITAITSLSPNCFSSNSSPMQEFTATSNIAPGQLYPADVQCQMLHGPGSRPCLGSGFSNLDEICTSMFCLVPTQSTGGFVRCQEYFAAEGTSCGNKKWCRSGVCEYSDNAPASSEKCPNGDSVVTFTDNKNCAEFVRENPVFCYNNTQRVNYCCKSCEDVRKDSTACPYGDKVIGCTKNGCGRTLLDGRPYAEDCCGTCALSVASNCVDVSSIDGVTCGIRTELNGIQECYNQTVATRCCQTCSRKETYIADCEYGDRHLDNNCSIPQDNLDVCIQRKSACCFSCRSYNKGSSIHSTALLMTVILLLWIC